MHFSRQVELMAKLNLWECRDATYQESKPPLVFSRAKGSRVWDSDGNVYLDMCAGFGVLSLGHNSDIQKEVFRASVEEDLVTHGMGDVYPSEDKVELLSCIGHILPKYLAKGSLALSGGQAVEIAVKTAQLATKKRGFISFEGSYHGLDLGILALTSREDFKAPFQPWLADHYVKELPFACHLDLVEAAIKRQNTPGGHGCAAVIVEPIQGRAGVRIPPSGWLEGLSAICQEQGVLLIFDEIFSGLGRCGQMTFADRVACDILCLGKALGAGLPLSACFARQEVMDAWPLNHGEAIHTGTFFGHPLSCRLGRANLAEIVKGGWISRAEAFGQEMLADLKVDIGSHPRVKDIRGMGMMIGIELNEAGLGAVWMDKLRVAGVIALASGMQGQGISLTPALNLSSSDWTDVRGLIKSTLSMV